jgi:hypothetical protein
MMTHTNKNKKENKKYITFTIKKEEEASDAGLFFRAFFYSFHITFDIFYFFISVFL